MVYFKFREYDQQVKSPAVYKLRRPTFHPLISVISGGGSKKTISYLKLSTHGDGENDDK